MSDEREYPDNPTDQLYTALAAAQAAITCPDKNREVVVKTKTGGSYKFRYATLDSIIEHIRKPLTSNGIWFCQTLEGTEVGKYRLVTRLTHSSGQSIESRTPLLVENAGNQAFGSALTYMRRYALTAMLGLAADEDDDGNAGDGNQATQRPTKKPVKKPAKKPPAQEQPEGYAQIFADGMTCIGKVNSPTDADAALNILRDFKAKELHVGTSEEDLQKAFKDRVAVIGVEYDKETGKFRAKDSQPEEPPY
jgi:hypothetical protein